MDLVVTPYCSNPSCGKPVPPPTGFFRVPWRAERYERVLCPSCRDDILKVSFEAKKLQKTRNFVGSAWSTAISTHSEAYRIPQWGCWQVGMAVG